MRVKIVLLILFFLFGCAKTKWYKEGATQWDFNKDEQECLNLAHRTARQATVGGKKENLEVFISSYENCLYQKGWSKIPQDTINKTNKISLAYINKNNTLCGLGIRLKLDKNFSVINEEKKIYGPTILHSFLIKTQDETFLNIVFQKSSQRVFKKIPYEVGEGYYIYDSFFSKKVPLSWTIYFGKFKQKWVKCLGAVYFISKKERIIVVISAPLSSTHQNIPWLGYSTSQIREIKEFSVNWLNWLREQFNLVDD